jgi:hypothetical protein
MAGLASQTRPALPSALVLDLDGVVADADAEHRRHLDISDGPGTVRR